MTVTAEQTTRVYPLRIEGRAPAKLPRGFRIIAWRAGRRISFARLTNVAAIIKARRGAGYSTSLVVGPSGTARGPGRLERQVTTSATPSRTPAGEQPQRQHEVHAHPGGQHPQPPLPRPSLRQHRIGQLERYLPGQLTQMAGREHPRRHRDRPGNPHHGSADGRLNGQRRSSAAGYLGGFPSYRTSVAMSDSADLCGCQQIVLNQRQETPQLRQTRIKIWWLGARLLLASPGPFCR
jgi:hypothetical protein